MHEAAFAGTRAPNKRHHFACGDLKADVCQHRLLGAGIREAHLIQHNGAMGALKRQLPVIGLRLGVNLRKEILSGSKASLNDALHVGQGANGLAQLGRRGNKRHQRTRRKTGENRGVQCEPKQRR